MADISNHDSDTDIYSLSQPNDSDAELDSLLSIDRLTIGSLNQESEQHDQQHDLERSTTTAQASKALEAATAEERSIRPTSSRATSRPSSPRSTVSWQGAPLDAGPAPPDYSQATAHRNLFSFNSVRPRSQDERIQQDAQDNWSELDSPSKSTSWKDSVCRNWKSLCVLSLIIYCSLVTVILITRHLTSRGAPSSISYKLSPTYPDHPSVDNYTSHPDLRRRFHPSTAACAFDSFSSVYRFSYPDAQENFTFTEAMTAPTDLEYSNFRISADVEIRPAPHDQDRPLDIWVAIATTAPWQMREVEEWWTLEPFYVYGQNDFQLLFPPLERIPAGPGGGQQQPLLTPPRERPCLHAWVGIYVNSRLHNWDIQTTVANVDIGYPASFSEDARWMFRVRDSARISTQSGNVSASFLIASDTEIRTESGAVKGRYFLTEHVNISSVSGAIDIGVEQTPSWHPDEQEPARLTTENSEGDTTVRLEQEPVVGLVHRKPKYNLHARHYSQSGNIKVDYGREFEGVVEGDTEHGSIAFNGRDSLWCLQAGGRPGPLVERGRKHLCAFRGAMNSTARFESVDGDVEVVLP